MALLGILPSNLLLAAVPLAPNLATGIALLLARFVLSQMDVPARQAYVVAVVTPEERTAAAAYTNSARYAARPVAPILAGALVQASTLAAPFVIAGTLKSLYDLAFYRMFRHIPLDPATTSPTARLNRAHNRPARPHTPGHESLAETMFRNVAPREPGVP